MAVDYDWVIIGDTREGRMAALKFAQSQARVALVQQPADDRVDCAEGLFLQGLGSLLTSQGEQELWDALGRVPVLTRDDGFPPFDYGAVSDWLRSMRERNEAALSLTALAIAGVDVVLGSGEFVRSPALNLVLPDRGLRSRFYLLATGATYRCPTIPGLSSVSYLTPLQLQQPEVLQALPLSLTMVGHQPMAVAWAQILRRLGHSVTLLSRSPLLPSVDRTLAGRLQAQLAAEGISVSASPIQHVTRRGDRLYLQLRDRTLDTEGLIIAGHTQPNLRGLKTERLGIESGQPRLAVNVRLQTIHPRIYVCGRIFHQNANPAFAEEEIRTILKNSLFLPLFSPNYPAVPRLTPTLPALATVGMTEDQAKARFCDRVSTLQQSLTALPKIQRAGEEGGYLKLVLLDDNQLLGAHLWGAGAEELISFFALAIHHRIGWKAIATLAFPLGTLAEGLQKWIDLHPQGMAKPLAGLRSWQESLWLWRR